MASLPKVKYSGAIREIKMGKPGCEVVVGGETAYNFYSFEGTMPHAPKFALQVLDVEPEEWAPQVFSPAGYGQRGSAIVFMGLGFLKRDHGSDFLSLRDSLYLLT
jgi:hypothetical protein